MNKLLTDNEKKHLQDLLDEAEKQQLISNSAIQSFIQYLSLEHNAPAEDGWRLQDINDGFVKVEESPNGKVMPQELVAQEG